MINNILRYKEQVLCLNVISKFDMWLFSMVLLQPHMWEKVFVSYVDDCNFLAAATCYSIIEGVVQFSLHDGLWKFSHLLCIALLKRRE